MRVWVTSESVGIIEKLNYCELQRKYMSVYLVKRVRQVTEKLTGDEQGILGGGR